MTLDGHPASCLDVSLGGARLALGYEVDSGDSVMVWIDTPGAPTNCVDARVVRVGEGVVAVRFTTLDPPSLNVLSSFMNGRDVG
jgi:hypothetical protein